jgi:hypothetical protein
MRVSVIVTRHVSENYLPGQASIQFREPANTTRWKVNLWRREVWSSRMLPASMSNRIPTCRGKFVTSFSRVERSGRFWRLKWTLCSFETPGSHYLFSWPHIPQLYRCVNLKIRDLRGYLKIVHLVWYWSKLYAIRCGSLRTNAEPIRF